MIGWCEFCGDERPCECDAQLRDDGDDMAEEDEFGVCTESAGQAESGTEEATG